MRVLRPRFILRRSMAAVAITGLVFGIEITRQRREGFLDRARIWDNTEFVCRQAADNEPGTHGDPATMGRLAEYAHSLRMKYERASRYPWLPVAPDPHEPE